MTKKSIVPFIIIIVIIIGIIIITNQKPKAKEITPPVAEQTQEVKPTDDTNTINSDLDKVDLNQDYSGDIKAIDEETNKL